MIICIVLVSHAVASVLIQSMEFSVFLLNCLSHCPSKMNHLLIDVLTSTLVTTTTFHSHRHRRQLNS